LASAGVTIDFLIENHLADAQTQSFALFGTTIQLSEPAAVLIGFALGALTIVCLALALSSRRRGVGRRQLKKRVSQLEQENNELRTRDHVFATADRTMAS
jgi:hypothetical protein